MITDRLSWTVAKSTDEGRIFVIGKLEWNCFNWIDNAVVNDETISIAKNGAKKNLIRELYGDVLDWLNDAERLIYDGNIAGLQESIFELRDKLNEKEPQK